MYICIECVQLGYSGQAFVKAAEFIRRTVTRFFVGREKMQTIAIFGILHIFGLTICIPSKPIMGNGVARWYFFIPKSQFGYTYIFMRALEWRVLIFLRPFLTLRGHLVYGMDICYIWWPSGIFFRFGILYQEKCGNPDAMGNDCSKLQKSSVKY
jgi:hypothetical protein